MNDDDRLSDPQCLRRPAQGVGLQRWRRERASADAGAPAMARTVCADDAEALVAQPLAKRDEYVGRVAGGAMNQERSAALLSPRGALKDVDRAAADIHARTRLRIARLDPPRFHGREACERHDDEDDDEKRDRHRAEAYVRPRRAARLTVPAPRWRP
jgi:hypothetical protein